MGVAKLCTLSSPSWGMTQPLVPLLIRFQKGRRNKKPRLPFDSWSQIPDCKALQHLSNSFAEGLRLRCKDFVRSVMAEVEEAEVEDVMTIDMDTIEAIVRSSEADTMPTQ
ncbi:hypothetical protein HAX54_033501 [Datura stramonium]|uniref:Uncharacterized protein n=1 Tax=Datura stramonium TaxID=4076 RepID=A0ABS8VG87_DATST|nr:hypothetical protein [Datura stramonium]